MTPSPAPSLPDAAVSQRLSPSALLAFSRDLVQVRRRGMFLLISLHRSDRLSALAQEPRSRSVLAEVMRRVEGILRPSDRDALETIGDTKGFLLRQIVEFGQPLVHEGIIGIEKTLRRAVFPEQMMEKFSHFRLHRLG